MQLASYLCQPLFQIFLDLSKAYDNLDRERIMSLMEAYGIGPHTRSIINALWEHELMVPKSADCFSIPFHPTRGVRQGDVISPLLFNIAVDAVLREWHVQVTMAHLTGLSAFFYADDGRIDGNDSDNVQEALNIMTKLFLRLGLRMNPTKTKAMIYFGHAASQSMSPCGYARRYDKSLPTSRDRILQKVTCPKCNKLMNRQSLTIHLREIHKLPSLQIPEIHCSDYGQQYIVDFPVQNVQTKCPVNNCPAQPKTRTMLRCHFCTMHHEDSIIIVQEGELTRCPNCRMFVKAVTPRHVVGSWCCIQAA
jgi:hypothetical protein